MIQGIYTASRGMTALMQRQDQIANNLSNINTTGFKESRLFTRSYQKYLQNDERKVFAENRIDADEVYTDYSQGTLRKTGSPLDLAVKGSGFFTVMGAHGLGYTRNGSFSLDPDGFLVTAAGEKVMGKNGFIRCDTAKPVTVSDTGEVRQEGASKGELRIADFSRPYRMVHRGNGLFLPEIPDTPVIESPGYTVRQGYLEASNVNMIRNMVEMIATHRNFEADQRALHAQDQTLDKAVNQVGRVG